ncbi:hypothetical protein TI39_contig414g00011 [Zymoseptoria brevis]|uniref:Secreted protein n=1 Tax=Zymoseptoria brevis TaxID=1047168 RepID=A0A0F4GQA7_9PEZI|nr:hypothetical protein TI39_contig414g00011 [Zymoseptoria brevis]
MLFSTLTLLVAALAPSMVVGQAGPHDKVSAPDHHNYGNQKGTWYWWDKEHIWKPVKCKSTAECKADAQKSTLNPYKKCPFPATHDKNYLDLDLALQYGGTACLPAPHETTKECVCGVGLNGDPALIKQWCTAYLAAAGLKDVSVLKGCVFGKPEDKNFAWNCTLQCGAKNKECIREVGAEFCKKGDKACIQKAGTKPYPLISKKNAPMCPA